MLNNYNPIYLYNQLNSFQNKNWRRQSLGTTAAHYPLWLFQENSPHKKRDILLAAGVHGDEPAPVLALIDFLQTYRPANFLNRVHVLPLINTFGFLQQTHSNSQGYDPNRGYCHHENMEYNIAEETFLILDALPLLQPLARNAFVALHEDSESNSYYVYAFEKSPQPTRFSHSLANILRTYFPLKRDGPIPDQDRLEFEERIENGICFNSHDTSLEDLFLHQGSPFTACTETPGYQILDQRISANRKIIEFMANWDG